MKIIYNNSIKHIFLLYEISSFIYKTQILKFMYFLLLVKKKILIVYKILLFVLENVTREQLLLLQGII